ncbi:MAG: hypothetical protein AAGI03_01520 [Pseudomonadota bacterium]
MTKFRLETKAGALVDALKLVSRMIPKRSTVPILSSVLIRDRKITATDLDTEMVVPFAATSMRGGLAAPLSGLDVLHFLPADTDITINETARGAILSFAGGSYGIGTFPAEDFPSALPVGKPDSLSGNAASGLPQALAGVSYAMSTEETRYYLNGVCLSAVGGEPCVVATDGHRLSWRYSHVPWGEDWHGAILPIGAVFQIAAMGACDRVTLFKTDDGQPTALRVEAGGARLTTKLIDGVYPDWRRVVPSSLQGRDAQDNGARRLVLPVKPLKAALRRLSSIRDDGRRLVLITPQPMGQIALSRRVHGELAVEVLVAPTDWSRYGSDARLSCGIAASISYFGELIRHATTDETATLVCHTALDEVTQVSGDPFGIGHERGADILMPMRPDKPSSLDLQARTKALVAELDEAA